MVESVLGKEELGNLRTVGEGLLLLSRLMGRAETLDGEPSLGDLGIEIIRQMGFSLIATSNRGEMPAIVAKAVEESVVHLEMLLADRAREH